MKDIVNTVKIEKEFQRYSKLVYKELKKLLYGNHDTRNLYLMNKYHLGFVNSNFKSLIKTQNGKAFRPILCMMINRILGGKISEVLPVASSIEAFHNFSLIHDDIEDNDEQRRGRPTLWRLWGLDHGVNTGDALFNLSYIELDKIQDSKIFKKIFNKFSLTYNLVIEGQYLDIEMAKTNLDDSSLNLTNYLKMIRRKSAELIGCACETGAIAAKADPKIQKSLHEFGINLGLAYQAYDDYAGVWKKESDTGKKTMKDIIQKKKMLPLIYCLNLKNKKTSKILINYYNRDINVKEAFEIAKLFELNGAKEYCRELSWQYKNKAIRIIKQIFPDSERNKPFIILINKLIKFEEL